MRELTIRIEFTSPSLGNVKRKDSTRLSGRFLMLRSPNDGPVLFLPTWWQANMRFAAAVLGRYQSDVKQIHWDAAVEGNPRQKETKNGVVPAWYPVYRPSKAAGKKRRYSLHEAFYEGQVVGINAIVPPSISDVVFHRLMDLIGRYQGISPYKPGEFGRFRVVSLQPRTAFDCDPEALEIKKAPGGSVPEPQV